MSTYDDCNKQGSHAMVFTIVNKTDIHPTGYPITYLNNMHCTWKFLAFDGFKIRLTIDEGGELEKEYDMLKSKRN